MGLYMAPETGPWLLFVLSGRLTHALVYGKEHSRLGMMEPKNRGAVSQLMPPWCVRQDHRRTGPDAAASGEDPTLGPRVSLPLLQLLLKRRALAPSEQ